MSTNPLINRAHAGAVATVKDARGMLEAQLDERLPTIAGLLPPKAGDPKRFVRMVMMAVAKTPELLNCDRTSLILAVMNCAELGLSCSGGPGARAHLVPFKDKSTGAKIVTLIADYKGLIDIALDSGKIDSIEAHAVWSNDVFEYELGTQSRLHHIPIYPKSEKDVVIGAYSVAWLRGAGRPSFRYLPIDEISRARPPHTFNDSAKNPWNMYLPEMCEKTAVRSHYKFLPTSPKMERVIDVDVAADMGVLPAPPANVEIGTIAPTQQTAEPDGYQSEVSETAFDGPPLPVPEREMDPIAARIAAAENVDTLKAIATEIKAMAPGARLSNLRGLWAARSKELKGAAS